jgi:uncharacterized membrane protein YfcA
VSDADALSLAALFAVGILSGALNVVAGGGSFLTLPVLIFIGLPAGAANATNRIGVLAQNLTGVWGFHRASRPWPARPSAPGRRCRCPTSPSSACWRRPCSA